MHAESVVRNAMTRERVAVRFTEPSLAKQSFKNECDINQLMRKYQKTGVIEHLNTHQGDYGNFIGFEDYQISLNRILEAEDAFSTIPSEIRNKFSNDPAKFLEFVQNPANLAEMQEMGLANPPRPESLEGNPTPEKPTTAAEAALAAGKPPKKADTTKEPPLV